MPSLLIIRFFSNIILFLKSRVVEKLEKQFMLKGLGLSRGRV